MRHSQGILERQTEKKCGNYSSPLYNRGIPCCGLLGFQLFHEESAINRLKIRFFCLSVLTGSQVKSFYDADERPMAVCEFSGFVAVESKILV